MALILIIAILVLLPGIAHIFYDAHCTKNLSVAIDDFLNNFNSFIIKYRNNEDNAAEVDYIMAHGALVSRYMGEILYNSPIITIQGQIRSNIIFTIEDEVRNVFVNVPEVHIRIHKRYVQIMWQLSNPFIWFYRGIEVSSYIVLGYIISIGSISYRGKAWNTFNIFFSIAAGVLTFIGLYLQIKTMQ